MGKLVALVVIALITSFILFGHRLIVNRTPSLPAHGPEQVHVFPERTRAM
jgi:hypothetical protein